MAATEYTAAAIVLLGVAFLFIEIAFRIERKIAPDSVIDFFDAIRFTFFAIGLWFALLAINFGMAVIKANTTDMANIFDTTIIIYTGVSVLLIVFGFVYVFVIIPRLLAKLDRARKVREEEEGRMMN